MLPIGTGEGLHDLDAGEQLVDGMEVTALDAADIIHALASREVYGLVVLDRGWNAERYKTWLRAIRPATPVEAVRRPTPQASWLFEAASGIEPL